MRGACVIRPSRRALPPLSTPRRPSCMRWALALGVSTAHQRAARGHLSPVDKAAEWTMGEGLEGLVLATGQGMRHGLTLHLVKTCVFYSVWEWAWLAMVGLQGRCVPSSGWRGVCAMDGMRAGACAAPCVRPQLVGALGSWARAGAQALHLVHSLWRCGCLRFCDAVWCGARGAEETVDDGPPDVA